MADAPSPIGNLTPLPHSPQGPKKRRWMAVLVIVAFALLLFSARHWLPQHPDATRHHAVGARLGPFEVAPLAGTRQSLDSAALVGHVVLINLWGPWCPPCRQELPQLARLAKVLGTEPEFQLVAVATPHRPEEHESLAEDVQRLLSEAAIRMPVYSDPERSLRQAAQQAGVYTGSYPTTWLLDRRGVIRGVWKEYYPGVVDDMQRLALLLLSESVESASAANARKRSPP